MAKISKSGRGKTLYITISVYPGTTDPRKNLTISCPDPDTRFKTSLSEHGLQKFRMAVLQFHKEHVLDRKNP